MISIPHKSKQFLVFLIKLLIVSGAFYFIYYQFEHNTNLDWSQFQGILLKKTTSSSLLFLLSLSILNRLLEIIKWQNLVFSFQKISIGEATKQVLSSLTAGIFTPNGVGEYAGKAVYFSKEKTKKIVFLNLICNGIQMIVTVFFGTIGLFILGYNKWAFSIIGISVFFIFFAILSKKIKIKGYSTQKLFEKINKIPKQIHQKNIVYGLMRYVVFSHQYYFLFLTFNVDLSYPILMATIAVVYFFASSLPSFQFLDFAVKGSIAVYFFQKLGVNNWIVLYISTLMWFLNVVLPVIIGSYFVLKFKPKWN